MTKVTKMTLPTWLSAISKSEAVFDISLSALSHSVGHVFIQCHPNFNWHKTLVVVFDDNLNQAVLDIELINPNQNIIGGNDGSFYTDVNLSKDTASITLTSYFACNMANLLYSYEDIKDVHNDFYELYHFVRNFALVDETEDSELHRIRMECFPDSNTQSFIRLTD
ncbi:hypothetical protein L4D76_00410 [Photobacterium sagamiensis]|uniref:hypothetical protein n=1 Tax=Photobacterium sagamiensis TaxID=2910241 RepID=UPI003D0D2ABC